MWMANRRISARLLDTHLHPEPQADVDAEQLSPLGLSSQQERNDTQQGEREKHLDDVARSAMVPDSMSTSASRTTPAVGPHQQRIYLFTLSLLIQLLIHGIINGYRAADIRPTVKLTESNGNAIPPSSLDNLSRYLNALFENGRCRLTTATPLLTSSTLALMTFALSTTLRSASFPIARCKQHLIVAAVAMPLAEMFSYTVITVIGITAAQFEVFPILALRSFTVSPSCLVTFQSLVEQLIYPHNIRTGCSSMPCSSSDTRSPVRRKPNGAEGGHIPCRWRDHACQPSAPS